MISESTVNEMQAKVLVPVVNGTWKREQLSLENHVKENAKPLTIAGDRRCDSPRFNAKYCTYYWTVQLTKFWPTSRFR